MKRIRATIVIGFTAALGLASFAATPARAQFGSIPKPAELVKVTALPLRAAAGSRANVTVRVRVRESWHVQANPASNPEAIATTVEVAGDSTATAGAPAYPPPHVVKLPIDDQPMKVWDGEVGIEVPLSIAAVATPGTRTLRGTLRFQACNDQVCLPPTSVPFTVALTVGGAPANAPADGRAPAGGTPPGAAVLRDSAKFATAPPVSGGRAAPAGAASSPLADLLARGGWIAFLSLFGIGLALNLTPCVYPMLGVTVSIFGARRAAPPLQVVGSALLYVLGIATMYSALGVAAALTGSLFGGWLANPLVSVGIGLLLVALSFSMFGLYELNLPPALLTRLGGSGATSAIGIFASGLAVGIIAAPCVGPPVVALLAVVGQRGDPLFGFLSFFTLAMGLGAPYLVLGTFSNLIQRMPRSGEWMLWVKKVFGVVLFSIGLNYVTLAFAPAISAWVLPIALMFGGLWLGLFDRTGSLKPAFRAFKIVAGIAAVLGGFLMMSEAPRGKVTFETLAGADAQLASAGQPILVEFSASWCIPCHELDRVTFADRAVITELGGFRRYRVDLTRYDSAESETWKRRFAIAGVPTMVFATPDGREIPGTRLEGFVPPGILLEHIQSVRAALPAAR